ncbi:hypothetical protein [Azospirillum argentinense]
MVASMLTPPFDFRHLTQKAWSDWTIFQQLFFQDTNIILAH